MNFSSVSRFLFLGFLLVLFTAKACLCLFHRFAFLGKQDLNRLVADLAKALNNALFNLLVDVYNTLFEKVFESIFVLLTAKKGSRTCGFPKGLFF